MIVLNILVWYAFYFMIIWAAEPLWLNNEEKEHWSEQGWWTNRHLTRHDDLRDDDLDKPNLFEEC
jgi:hypothetical protein